MLHVVTNLTQGVVPNEEEKIELSIMRTPLLNFDKLGDRFKFSSG